MSTNDPDRRTGGAAPPVDVRDTDELARRFRFGTREFASSPLYQRLAQIIAADEELLGIAARCRAGQQPTNLLFAAVHFVLLGADRDAELAGWYPSLGGDRPVDDEALPAAFTAFCRRHRARLCALVSSRLVQTNVVKRSAALRVGMAVLAEELGGAPVTLLEVGASSGIHLAFDRYRCRIGDAAVGPPDSPVLIEAEWRSPLPVPTAVVPVGARLGVDLHPIPLADEVERRWLRALIWPENLAQAALLTAATELVAADPPRIVAGDAATTLPALDADLPTDVPLLVWHAATRAHVSVGERPAFDAAIAALGRRRPLYTLSLETPDDHDAWFARYGICYALSLRGGAGPARLLAAVHGHVDWLDPISR